MSDSVNTMYDQAVALKDEGKLDEAVAKLREVLALDDNHTLSHSALAVYLQKQNQFDEAIAHAQKVTELEPHDPFSFTQLSVIYQRCGKIPEAEDAMAHARAIQTG